MTEALLRLLRRVRRPGVLGTVRRTRPLSDTWGFDRGTPLDRHFIEAFLARHSADVRGRVLEVRSDDYARRFGNGIQRADVLDNDPNNPRATVIADLAAADGIPAEQFDCFILTQTLQLIFDVESAIRHSHRILRRGGVLLVTVPVVSRLVPRYGLTGDYWRFTPASCARLFSPPFEAEQLTIRSHGNVLLGVGFLLGMAAEEFTRRELESHDDYFPILMSVRAVKT